MIYRIINFSSQFLSDWNMSSGKPRQSLPTVIQFPINNICNSRCQMCDIWQQKKGYEISPSELRSVLTNPLFRKVKNIGINGGEPTLRKDFSEVVKTIVECLPKLSGISLITNGIQDSRIISSIDSFAQICYENNIQSDVMVSIDGYGDIHDKVRGRIGNFLKSTNVVNYLINNTHINTKRIGCTIVSDNAMHLERLFLWALDKGIYIKFRLGIPHNRLYSNDERNAFKISDKKIFHIANFLDYIRLNYEQDSNQQEFYLSLRNQLVYGSKRAAGCSWKNTGVTLLSDGGFAYCAVESPTLGNTISECSSKMYWENSNILKDIVRNKCDSCMHDYVGLGTRRQFFKHYFRKIKKKLPTLLLKNLRIFINLFFKYKFINTVRKSYNEGYNIKQHSKLKRKGTFMWLVWN